MKNSKNNNVYHKPYTPPAPKTPPKSGIKSKIKNSLNKILFWVIISAFCLFTVGSTLGIIAFSRTAKAEESTISYYEYTQNYIPNNCRPLGDGYLNSVTNPVFGLFDFCVGGVSYDNQSGGQYPFAGIRGSYYNTSFNVNTVPNLPNINLGLENNYYRVPFTYSAELVTDPDNYEGLPIDKSYYKRAVFLGFRESTITVSKNIYAVVYVCCSTDFNGIVSSIKQFSIYRTYPNAGGNSTQTYILSARNNIHFVDTNGNVLCFSFLINVPNTYSSTQAMHFTLRAKETYVFESGDGYVYYQSGYNDGLNVGLLQGEQIGYDKGYVDGEDAGYELGRIDGISQASDYTLYSLISAIFNVPLISFVHLINFEFFGVNLANFFTGCLTVGVILFIVSKIFGK